MEKTQILTIGRDPVLLQKLSRFINENAGWESTATIDDETAIELFHLRSFDIILLLKDVQAESVKKLTSVLSHQKPELIILDDIGDSTEILEDTISKAVQNAKPAVNIVDDAFKDATKE